MEEKETECKRKKETKKNKKEMQRLSEKDRARQKVEGACLKASHSDWRVALKEPELE